MSERVLAEWEGEFLSIFVEHPDSVRGARTTGRIVRVGNDGIIFQPTHDPRQTENLPPPKFYPWHAILAVEKHEPQEQPS